MIAHLICSTFSETRNAHSKAGRLCFGESLVCISSKRAKSASLKFKAFSAVDMAFVNTTALFVNANCRDIKKRTLTLKPLSPC